MKRQSGITLIGFVVVLIVAAFAVYTGMKLVPAYMDYFSISKALSTVASNASASTGTVSVDEMRRQLAMQQISQYFDDSDIKQGHLEIVQDPRQGSMLRLDYDKQIPWIYNIDFLVHFQKSVQLKNQAQE